MDYPKTPEWRRERAGQILRINPEGGAKALIYKGAFISVLSS
jgi:hypothetical protein